MDTATLSAILLAIIGGGGLVPFVWRLWTKYHPREVEDLKTRTEIESISSHAANETIDAMKGAMGALRQQLIDGKAENELLRRELESNREKITMLERKVEVLIREIVRLGGSPDALAQSAT